MGKIIISEKQLETIKKKIAEEIDPTEANSNMKSLQTVINGRRGVGFYGGTTEKEMAALLASGLKYINIGVNKAYVFYSEGHEEEAMQLARIAKKNNGYLPTNSPEETYIIGILLGYDKKVVKDFVLGKFPNFKFYQ